MTILRNMTVSQNSDQLDAFSNTRTANPSFVADGQFTYDLQPLLYETSTAGDGTVTHEATERAARLRINTATGSGDKAIIQSYNYYRYQAGRAQEIFLSFNFKDNTGVADIRKFMQYGDATNSVGFELNGTAKNFYVKSGTSAGNTTVARASWNIDPMDGTGPSGITLDTSKTQILVISIQPLYVGLVRIGFDIGGDIVWCHQFAHANVDSFPYIQDANLPLRAGVEATAATVVDSDMLFICYCVLSRGGEDDVLGYDFSAEGAVTAANGTQTHLISIRPKALFNGFTNRTKILAVHIDILVTGSSPVLWELCIGQALTAPTYTDVNATYSTVEVETAGTLSGAPGIVLAKGYCSSSAQVKGAIESSLRGKYPLTLDLAGVARDMGTLTLLVTGLGGTSACRGGITWVEIH